MVQSVLFRRYRRETGGLVSALLSLRAQASGARCSGTCLTSVSTEYRSTESHAGPFRLSSSRSTLRFEAILAR